MKRFALTQLWPELISRDVAHVFDRVIEVGILEHDVRIAAAELEHRLFERRARLRRHRFSRGRAARQRHRAHERVLDHRLHLPAADQAACGTRPFGNPACTNISSIASAQPGTFDACFRTPALPAMSAGAANRKTCQNGKFHGMTASTTPSGSNAT